MTNKPENSMSIKRSPCPLAASLDYLGDKWSLLIIRDMLLGRKLYSDFQQSPENIPTNILADRLKRLQHAGLVKKQLYQQHPPRYEYLLTEMGADLLPVLQALGKWGKKHIPGTRIMMKAEVPSNKESE